MPLLNSGERCPLVAVTPFTGDALEVAWAGGIFEGEGSIVPCSTTRKGVFLRISMTDWDVLERFRLAVQAGTVRGPYERPHVNHKAIYHYQLSRHGEVDRVIGWLWPYLGERRRARATELFAIRDEARYRTCFCGKHYYATKLFKQYCSVRCKSESRKSGFLLTQAQMLERKRTGRKFSWEEAAELRRQGMTYSEVAMRLGVSDTAILYALDPKCGERQRQWRRDQKEAHAAAV